MSGPHARTWGRSADPAGVNPLDPTPAGAPHTSDHTRLGGDGGGDAEDRSRHDPRRELGLGEQQPSAMHALAVALLLAMPHEELFDALREVLVLHGVEPLDASTGAGCPPSPGPVEAHTQDP